MTSNGDVSPVATSGAVQPMGGGYEPANLADILERVLDRGLVVAGDIRISLLDIELLTIKLRLVIASMQTAKQVGMDWWERDPWFTGNDNELRQENERLRAMLAERDQHAEPAKAIDGGQRRQAKRAAPAKRSAPAKRTAPAKRAAPAKRVRRPRGGDEG